MGDAIQWLLVGGPHNGKVVDAGPVSEVNAWRVDGGQDVYTLRRFLLGDKIYRIGVYGESDEQRFPIAFMIAQSGLRPEPSSRLSKAEGE